MIIHPIGALKCALYALTIRVFVGQLRRSMESLRSDPTCDNEAVNSILNILGSRTNLANIVIPEDVSFPALLDACQIADSDKEQLIALLQQNAADDTEKHEDRSVKTL